MEMIRIIDKRATGKTSRLMLLAKETGAIVVCINPDIYKTKAERYGIVGIDFVSYRDYFYELEKRKGNKYQGREVLIDELELFLNALDSHIKGYSLSQD